MSSTDTVWKNCLIDIDSEGFTTNPRGMWVKEVLGYSYKINMANPIISLDSRKMNYGFMYGEAAWICKGSNWLDELTPFMKRYADFSDDKVFLNGAYGVKVVEQATYVTETLAKDENSRQAVLNIWRERPGVTKDIPCTINMQFLIRQNKLEMIVNMRSQDAVLGFSYDVFTFSAVAGLIRTMLALKGINVALGMLHVNVGSFHIYEEHFSKLETWINDVSPHIDSRDAHNDWLHISRDTVLEPRDYVTQLESIAYEYKGLS